MLHFIHQFEYFLYVRFVLARKLCSFATILPNIIWSIIFTDFHFQAQYVLQFLSFKQSPVILLLHFLLKEKKIGCTPVSEKDRVSQSDFINFFSYSTYFVVLKLRR